MGTGPSLGLLTTSGTPALGKLNDVTRLLLTSSKVYPLQECGGSRELAQCWDDQYASPDRGCRTDR